MRASSLAHEGLHALQLRTADGLVNSHPSLRNGLNASQSVRHRRPTRVVLGSDARDSSSESSGQKSSRRQRQSRDSASGGSKARPGRVVPLSPPPVQRSTSLSAAPGGRSPCERQELLRQWEAMLQKDSVTGPDSLFADPRARPPPVHGAAAGHLVEDRETKNGSQVAISDGNTDRETQNSNQAVNSAGNEESRCLSDGPGERYAASDGTSSARRERQVSRHESAVPCTSAGGQDAGLATGDCHAG